MFNLCENSAFARNEEKSVKYLNVKMTIEEKQALEEMREIIGEKYVSNVVRIALKNLYNELRHEIN